MRTTSRSSELASSSRRLTPVTSRWVTSSTLDLLKVCQMTLFVGSTSLRSGRNGVLGDHLASILWWRPSQKPTWRPVTSSRRYRKHPERHLIPWVLWSQDPCLRWSRQLRLLQRFPPTLCQHRTSTPFRLQPWPPWLRLCQSQSTSIQLPSSQKNYMPTLVNVQMNGLHAKIVEKVGAATIVASKATWPATVQSIDRHPQDENVENQDQARHEEIRVETVRDGFDPAPRAKNGRRWPRKHLRGPGGGRSRKRLNTTISTSKPEKNSTLGGVNVEGTEPEHASLFTVRGRICERRDDSFDSSSELLVDCGATSDFMSMQTAKRARLPLYKLTNPGHVLTAGGVRVEVRYYTRAYARVGELRISTSLQGLGDSAGCGAWTTMASKL